MNILFLRRPVPVGDEPSALQIRTAHITAYSFDRNDSNYYETAISVQGRQEPFTGVVDLANADRFMAGEAEE